MRVLRKIVGAILLFLNRLTMPRKAHRSSENLESIRPILATYSIYEFDSCPFCIKLRRHLQRRNLDIELRNVLDNSKYKEELVQEGGQYMVPCLRMEKDGKVEWMYESSDIIAFLDQKFPLESKSLS